MTETANRWIGFYMMATMTFKSFLTNVQVFLSFQWVSNGNIGQIWINGLNIVKLDHKSYIGIYTSYNPNWFVSGLLYDGLAGLRVPALPLLLLKDAEFKFAPPQYKNILALPQKVFSTHLAHPQFGQHSLTKDHHAVDMVELECLWKNCQLSIATATTALLVYDHHAIYVNKNVTWNKWYNRRNKTKYLPFKEPDTYTEKIYYSATY